MGEKFTVQPFPAEHRVQDETPQAAALRGFKLHGKHKEASRIVKLAFCPTVPHTLAVVAGTKIGLWKAAKDGELQHDSNVSKFKDLTQCVSWRSDGKLLLGGEASGSCAVVETNTRQVLRRFRGHGDAVTCAAFAAADRSRAATGAGDGKLRIWDVATSELITTVDAHKDRMRVLSPGAGGPDIWITAGYDGFIRMFDAREKDGSRVAAGNHGHPIEDGVPFPGYGMFVTVGGTVIKVWDLSSGGKMLYSNDSAHSKVITGVSLDSEAALLLTSSFDSIVRVSNAADLSHVYAYTLPGPATTVTWRPDGGAFAVGLDDGTWLLRSGQKAREEARKTPLEEAQETQEALDAEMRRKRGIRRGTEHLPQEGDEVVEGPPKKFKENSIEFLLRKFEYKGLMEWIAASGTTEVRVTLGGAEVLVERGHLSTAMSDLSPQLCEKLLQWLSRAYSADGANLMFFFELLHTLIDSNPCLNPPSTPGLVKALQSILMKVNQHMKGQETLAELTGMLAAVIAD